VESISVHFRSGTSVSASTSNAARSLGHATRPSVYPRHVSSIALALVIPDLKMMLCRRRCSIVCYSLCSEQGEVPKVLCADRLTSSIVFQMHVQGRERSFAILPGDICVSGVDRREKSRRKEPNVQGGNAYYIYQAQLQITEIKMCSTKRLTIVGLSCLTPLSKDMLASPSGLYTYLRNWTLCCHVCCDGGNTKKVAQLHWQESWVKVTQGGATWRKRHRAAIEGT
jgi:hypothetical protein